MLQKNERPAHDGNRGRADRSGTRSADDIHNPIRDQVLRTLARRFVMPLATAAVIAELAKVGGGVA